MRSVFAVALVCLALSGSAQAGSRHHAHFRHAQSSPSWTWSAAQPIRRVVAAIRRLSGECRRAAALGGPCGCYASEQVFGRSIRSLWLAGAWLKFPRTSAHAGAVAVFLGRRGAYHVALVESADGRGVTLRDSWAVHRVSARGLVFVEPRVRS